MPVYLPQGEGAHLWAAVGSVWGLAALWLAAVNVATFGAFGLDKRLAKRKRAHPRTRRISERTLFLLAILGGSAGALLGMGVFRHKTLHRSFRWGIPGILALQALALLGFWLLPG